MPSLVVGSAKECDLRADDPFVSPRHCRVVKAEDGTLWVVDLGSANGTFLASSALGSISAMLGIRVRLHDELRVRGTPEPWRPGATLWVGQRVGLELDAVGWVRAVSR
jgi:pSer/pThr/pTyr-binding forkhead associated (FHA) protein